MPARDPSKPYPFDYVLRATVLRLIPLWVTPNQVTVFRMVLTPFVMYLLLVQNFDWGVPLFFLAALTDAIDGAMARTRNQVTAWGSFYDPFADKVLIGSVVLLIVMQHINPWIGVVMLVLELMLITGGWWRRRRGEPTVANVWGKTKMVLQTIGVGFLLISIWHGIDLFIPLSAATFSVAIAFAVVSLLTYGI